MHWLGSEEEAGGRVLWRKLAELEGLLTCTGHPQTACMVVVLTVRIIFD